MLINGVELREVHPALSINKEIPPGMPTRTIHTIIAGDAETYAGTTMERGEYEVRVNIACKTRAEAWNVRALLAKWAAGSGDGLQELVPTHWPMMAYDAVVESISPPEFIFGFAMVVIIFVLPNPAAHERIECIASGKGSAQMQIDGSLPVRPVISQELGAARDGLTLSLDGAPFFVIRGALAAGQKIVIDTQNGALTIGGAHAEARIDYTATTWAPGFKPGRHTITSSDGGKIEVRWRNRWM